MTLAAVTKAVYALLGRLYVLAGIGAMVLPLGWVSPSWAGAPWRDQLHSAADHADVGPVAGGEEDLICRETSATAAAGQSRRDRLLQAEP